MGFSRQEYWSELPFPPSGNLPDPGTEPVSQVAPALAGGFFTSRATGEACILVCNYGESLDRGHPDGAFTRCWALF